MPQEMEALRDWYHTDPNELLTPSIENRPAQIRQRSERGHWEMDLIIGKAETSHILLTSQHFGNDLAGSSCR